MRDCGVQGRGAVLDDKQPVAADEGIVWRTIRAIVTAGGVLAGISIVLILGLVCLEVVLRQFKKSTMIADEFAGYLNVAVVFLGLAYTLREGGFIRVELLYDRLKGGIGRAVRWFIVLASTVYVGVALYYMILHTAYSYQQDTRAVSVSETPEYLPQSIVVIGLALLLLQLVAYIIDRVRRIP
jgi:TRAP-type C4-dicarboxylate transport system permease small subunit